MRRFIALIILVAVTFPEIFAQDFGFDPFEGYDNRTRGQANYENTTPSVRYDADSMVCVFSEIGLRETPGPYGRFKTTLYFGDQVRISNAPPRRFGGKNYLEVMRGTEIGWVEEDAFIKGGGVVVLLTDKQIHNSPNVASATSDYFKAGDLYVLTDFDGSNWVELMTRQGTTVGWIKGIDEVSFSQETLGFANLIHQARRIEDANTRKVEFRKIKYLPGFSRSELAPILERMLLSFPNDQEVAYSDPEDKDEKYIDDGERSKDVDIPSRGESPSFVVEKVIDMESGRYYNRVTENGQIAEVDGPKKPKSIYWCYHKTRPINSKVLLHMPEGGFVQLEVVARLRKSNSASIGLGKKLLESVYGTRHAKDASFSYPQ